MSLGTAAKAKLPSLAVLTTSVRVARDELSSTSIRDSG